jgi:excisionase family DNA binding protein
MAEEQMIDTYYTVDEVATALKVNARSVRSLISKHKLDAVKVGREFRIPERSLKKYLGEDAP